jgi:hypothetical protein
MKSPNLLQALLVMPFTVSTTCGAIARSSATFVSVALAVQALLVLAEHSNSH